MSTPPLTILDLPHEVDRRVLVEDYVDLPAFLRGAENVREREWGNGNGKFFHIVAAQWMALASLQYVFLHQPTEVIETAKRAIKDFLLCLELGHRVEPQTSLEYFSAALAVNDRSAAQSIISAPDELLGLLDPDDPMPLLVTAIFVLFAEEDNEVRLNMEMLHGILFENPLDKAYYPMKTEMVSLYHLITSILEKDEAAFNKRLLERCQSRVGVMKEADEDDKPSIVDWTALGLVCLARDRGLTVTIEHVYLPLRIVETAYQQVLQQPPPSSTPGARVAKPTIHRRKL